jgi:hypothetical protein
MFSITNKAFVRLRFYNTSESMIYWQSFHYNLYIAKISDIGLQVKRSIKAIHVTGIAVTQTFK